MNFKDFFAKHKKIIFAVLCILIGGICLLIAFLPRNNDIEEIPTPVIEEKKPIENHIIVVFGYGYNEPSFVQNCVDKLSTEFGLIENQGLIDYLVYPDSFSYDGAVGRISILPELLSEKKVAGLLILGAPDNTHKSLARLQDNGITYPIFSLLPQDDILGTEAGSNIVLDFMPDSQENISIETQDVNQDEETTLQNMDLVPLLLSDTVKAMQEYSNQESSKELLDFLNSLYGNNWLISSYVDSETGIKAINHYVLEKKPEEIIPDEEIPIEENKTKNKRKKK